MYGYSSEKSDLDVRGVHMSVSPHYLYGLGNCEQILKQDNEDDFCSWELRHTFKLLRKGNTQIIELLWNDKWLYLSSEWQRIQQFKMELMDSETIFNCLRGYAKGELNFVLGVRTGKLGGKRHADIEKYGYSFKNAVNLIRLYNCGITFFKRDYYPTDMLKEDCFFFLKELKFSPEQYNKEDIRRASIFYERMLEESYQNRAVNHKFNANLADDLLGMSYYPYIEMAYRGIYL